MGKPNREKFVQVWMPRTLRDKIRSSKKIIERKKKEGYRASCWEVIEYYFDSGIHEQVVVPLNVTTLHPITNTVVKKIRLETVNVKLRTTVNYN